MKPSDKQNFVVNVDISRYISLHWLRQILEFFALPNKLQSNSVRGEQYPVGYDRTKSSVSPHVKVIHGSKTKLVFHVWFVDNEEATYIWTGYDFYQQHSKFNVH